jgi:adenylosuccinate lyase
MESHSKESYYQSPFSLRYASKRMREIFSAQHKYSTWRRLWVALAEAQHKLGLPISHEQIQEMEQYVYDINFEKAAEYEERMQHDVMAHIHAFGDQAQKAKPIIHLGATSCFVTDNGDLIQMHEALLLIIDKLNTVLRQLAAFAKEHARTPCLGYTHFQSAQLTTVGKRACLWIQDFLMDVQELDHRVKNMKFLGVKGTTGTQASFLSLLKHDKEKVRQLDSLVASSMGFNDLFTIAGQTYTRKQDILIMSSLAGIAASAHKFATDIRLLSHTKEIEEPFGHEQVGSSAMPYKRNPILSERICGLARFAISLSENPYYTEATQWLERSLDDSANRRLCIPEAFLTVDAILELLIKVTNGLVVNTDVIARLIHTELPFMATENLLMAAVKNGKDRQKVHELLRVHSLEAADRVKNGDGQNDLFERLSADSNLGLSREDIETIVDVEHFIGMAPDQVETFLEGEVRPYLL